MSAQPSWSQHDNVTTEAGALALLRHRWTVSRSTDELPPFDDVAIRQFGAWTEHCALFSFEGDQLVAVRAGRHFATWFGGDIEAGQEFATARTDSERVLLGLGRACMAAAEPRSCNASRIRGGTIYSYELLALPLSSRRGPPLVLACVRETASELSLLHTISEATHQGILALAPIRDEAGAIVDFQIVAVNDSAAGLMRRRQAELLWARTSQLKVGMRSLGVFERLEIVLREGRRDEFDLCYEMLDKSELHLRVSAAPIDDLIAISLADVTELKTREASFRLLFEANPVPMWLVDPNTLRFVGVNGAALSYYGFTRRQFLAMTTLDIRPAEEHAALVEVIRSMGQVHDGGRVWRHLRGDGSEVTVISYARSLTFEGQAAILVANIDVTERNSAEAELRRTRAFLDAVVESVPAMLFVKNADDHRYILFNAAGERMLGVSRDEVIGRTVHDLHAKEHADAMRAHDLEVLESGKLQTITDELVQTRHNGVRTMRIKKIAVPDESGRPKYLLGISEDITEQCEAQARIAHMAHHDALTDLPNRVLFRERMNEAFAHLRRYGSEFALLCVDLDEFKAVNDSLGHSVGDLLLKEVSARLKGCLGDADLVARLGGDEFAVVQPGVKSPDDASDLAERLVAALCKPYHHGGQEIVVGASIGIAMAPHDANDSETLLRNADLALYRAKGDGRRTFRFFEPEMNVRLQTRRALERDLRAAFSNGDFTLFYQPIVDLASNRVSGVEALLRWPHATRGMVSPAEFIPLAEDIGLITQLGNWVLRQACKQAALWPARIKIAVNLSPIQFRSSGLVQSVILALASSGLPASRLELEITESVLLADSAANLAILHQLRNLGVRIAMDDFGTGYSSLSYLRSFPFDKIKIDQSFIREMASNPGCSAIIRAVTGLGADLDMTTTAEGVETEAQLEQLRAHGCVEAQGYLFSKPRPANELTAIIEGVETMLARAA